MREPKYKLNQKDDARWQELLARHCVNYTDIRGRVHTSRVFPPLSAEEDIEFERLHRKRSRKIASRPRVAASIRRGRQAQRQTTRRLRRLEKLMADDKK